MKNNRPDPSTATIGGRNSKGRGIKGKAYIQGNAAGTGSAQREGGLVLYNERFKVEN